MIFTATLVPSVSVPVWTCAIEAAAVGASERVSRSLVLSPSSLFNKSRTACASDGTQASRNEASFDTYAGGARRCRLPTC